MILRWHIWLVMSLVSCCASDAQDGKLREWTSDTGTKLQAVIVGNETATTYVLRKADETEVRVPADRLSPESRTLAENLLGDEPEQAKVREWTSDTGTKLQAAIVGRETSTTYILRKADGTEVRVPADRLSPESRTLAESLLRNKSDGDAQGRDRLPPDGEEPDGGNLSEESQLFLEDFVRRFVAELERISKLDTNAKIQAEYKKAIARFSSELTRRTLIFSFPIKDVRPEQAGRGYLLRLGEPIELTNITCSRRVVETHNVDLSEAKALSLGAGAVCEIRGKGRLIAYREPTPKGDTETFQEGFRAIMGGEESIRREMEKARQRAAKEREDEASMIFSIAQRFFNAEYRVCLSNRRVSVK